MTSNVGQFTYLAIDLDKTNSRLNAAKIAIRNKSDQAAEDSLSAIGSNLVAFTVSTDLPLLTAREDLALAYTALNEKNTRAADADLHQASAALAAYAASGPHAADAKALSGQIDTAAANTTNPNLTQTSTPQPVSTTGFLSASLSSPTPLDVTSFASSKEIGERYVIERLTKMGTYDCYVRGGHAVAAPHSRKPWHRTPTGTRRRA